MLLEIPGCFGCATPFTNVQIWISHKLHGYPLIVMLMQSKYGWHVCETLHFVGLSLLLGTIGVFDLRVLGIAKNIPIAALHRLTPWGIGGYGLNVITGFMFLIGSFPEQYLYQWSFIIKIGFMLVAGINAVLFNLLILRKVQGLGPGDDAPIDAKIMCAASLCLWVGVVFAGRLLAFYKPLFTIPPP